jgi:hypothetical protein
MNRCSVALLTVAAASRALGQILGPETCLSCDYPAYRHAEVAGIASPNNSKRVLAVWQMHGPATRLLYAVSTNGGNTFTTGIPIPTPDCGALDSSEDPLVAASYATGDLYGGGFARLADAATQPLFVARVPDGSVAAQSAVALGPQPDPCQRPAEKGMAAIGPCPGGSGCEALYGVSLSPTLTSPGGYARWDAVPTGLPSTFGPIASDIGYGFWPLVLRHGDVTGRVVVGGLESSTIGSRTRVTLSDTGGSSWTTAHVFANYAAQPTSGVIVAMPGDQSTPPTDFFAGTSFFESGFCSGAADPNDSHNLVFAFCGLPDGQNNVDVFVAVSTDGGASFGAPTSPTVYRIPDWMLRRSDESTPSHELQPAITIDVYGGVDLMVMRTATNSLSTASMRFARWPNLASLTGGAAPQTLLSLTGEFTVDASFPVGAGMSGNDYQMITTSGCYLWCFYSRSGQASGNVYVRRIDVCPPAADIADFDRDSTVTTSDAVAFMAAYATGASTADVDGNQTINAADAVTYLNAYNQATNP